MLRPSYSELMEKLDQKEESQEASGYTIVIAASKRARQLIDGADPLAWSPTDKAVSVAVNEMKEGMIIITKSNEGEFQDDAIYAEAFGEMIE